MTDDNAIRTGSGVIIPWREVEVSATRARGPGGQHVNKASTAIQLRWDLRGSDALDDEQRRRLLAARDARLSAEGVLVIRAGNSRSQARNRDEAVRRLVRFIDQGLQTVTPRKPTRRPSSAVRQRLKEKARRSETKDLRKKPET